MNKERLIAFTDAVVAIAATIMVLELHVPKTNDISGLLQEWPTFFAYIISFVLIYLVWFNHHNIFEKAKKITVPIFIYNGIWLFFLSLVPFTTNWVGEAPNERLPQMLYILNFFLWSLMFQVMDNQIVRDNQDTKLDISNSLSYRLQLYGSYAITLIICFFSPIWALGILGIMIVGLQIEYAIQVAKN